MSLSRCIPDLLANGAITPEQGDEMLRGFEDLRRQKAGQYGEAAADAMAGEAVLKALAAEKALAKRQAALAARAQGKITLFLDGFAAPADRLRAAKAVIGTITGVGRFVSVEQTFDAVWRLATGNNAMLFEKYGASLFRGRITSGKAPKDLVRAMFGGTVEDPAISGMARALGETFEYLRLRFNAAGGAIGKLESWGLPQAHDWLKVRDAGFDAWRTFVMPRLDTAGMIDGSTGQPFSPERLELALRDVWESIRTGGWNKREAGMQGLGKLANRRGDPRFLKFADADAWMQYQAEFGSGDIWGGIIGHLHGMARDIAAMEVLGPNPQATVDWLTGSLEKEISEGPVVGRTFDKAASRLGQAQGEIQRMWDTYTGTANGIGGSQGLADFASGTRAFLTAVHLAGATVSALSDPIIGLFNKAWNGIPMMQDFGQSLRFLDPTNAEDRMFAAQLGAGMDDAIGHSIALLRYTGEATVNGKAQWLAAATLRASGLNFWTEAHKRASAWNWSGHLARERGKAFAVLEPQFRAALERYTIGADEWDAIRAVEPVMRGNAPFLKPGDVYANPALEPAQADAIVTKLMALISSEEKNSVIQSSLRGRAVAAAGGKPGTVSGEVWRSLMQFKQFPLEIVLRSLGRLVNETGVPSSQKAAYAMMFPALTIAGMMILQLKAIAQGKDPRPMDDPKLWMAAAAQGGGLGLFGDFLFVETGRFGRSFAETMAGPTVAAIADAKDFVQGNVTQALAGEDTNAGREVVKLARRYVPGSKLWYLRLTWDRLVNDSLQRMLDPGHQQAWDRVQRNAERDFGQGFWWAPGEDAPDRAPDIENAFEGTDQ